jgi:inorganic pyrophosphatase
LSKKSKFGQGPLHLPPYQKNSCCLQVIIETPKGGCNRYAFEPEQSVFALKKVLPAGMAFAYDFGFIPSTLAEDGDPMDVPESKLTSLDKTLEGSRQGVPC